MCKQKEIREFQDFLFGIDGNCSVYFHVEVSGKSYVIRADQNCTASCSDEVIEEIKTLPCVADAWKN